MELSQITGLNKMVSYGNRVDVDEGDLIAYLGNDKQTTVIGSYLEGLGNGRKFLKSVAKAHKNKKPVVVFKTGRTMQAAHASVSHTGAHGGSYKLYYDILSDNGVILTDSLHGCHAACIALAMQPPAKGNNVALVSNGAGPMVNALDLFPHNELVLATLDNETIQTMRNHFSFYYIVNNPVDITGSATSDDYDFVLTSLLQDDGVDIIMPFFVFQNTPLDEAIIEKMEKHSNQKKKPIICCCTNGSYSDTLKEKFISKGMPMFTQIDHWVTAAYAVMQWGRKLKQES
jgi:3-hydroxypropionyl-CoA synthetase (ADP-forming)